MLPRMQNAVPYFLAVMAQDCQAGTCVCKSGFSPCSTRGGRCLDTASCPSGSGGAASNIGTEGVGGI